MTNKLTYKIKEIITSKEYTDVIIKHKHDNYDVEISSAKIKFRYEPKVDKSCLSFGDSNGYTVCEVEDKNINEVILLEDSLSIETDEKIYYCYIDKKKLYY
ncbi:hypothetical protein PBV87_10980 [Niameybacter massiliensis]|uniref:Uncharacterized protein n=1 Tax=Holtiella tumoricola TaxID=3018743 RepID=A0AA42J113_9FIRM|nr:MULTISPECIES: hypothetical protein [Lachnospirales]MDA3732004.1 hypothetical protein [Holtiella tumoricola]